MVTAKELSFNFFLQVWVPKDSKDFLHDLTGIFIINDSMQFCKLFVKIFSLMYGYNPLMWSWISELFITERPSKSSSKQDIFDTAEFEYTEALRLVMMLIWNISTTNQENQKHKSEK